MVDPGGTTRRLSAILSADAVGYTRLMANDEVATVTTLNECRDTMARLIEDRGGRVVDAAGDNLLAEFPSVVQAVTSAMEIQRALRSHDRSRPPDRRMPFRVGLNLGDLIIEGERIYGDGVNIAARVQGLAEPGGICLSASAFDQVEGKLNLDWDDLGEHVVKNFPKAVHVYRIKLGLPDLAPLTPTEPEPGSPSIAILPLESFSLDDADRLLADGMTEDLITLLSHIPGFFVIARSSVFGFKGLSPDVRQVGHDLGVRYVVEGGVRRLGQRLRVTVRLVDAESRRQLWAEKYDSPLEQFFELQDEVTEGIAAQLHPQLAKAEISRAARVPTAELDAWVLYQSARRSYLLAQTHRSLEAAIELCKQALHIDPKYSNARALLGMLLADRVFLGWSKDPDRDEDEAWSEGRRAVEEAPEESAVLYHWGVINAELGELKKGISVLERSLELNPNDAHVYAVLGGVLVAAGSPTEGIERIERAMRLSPRDPYRYMWLLWLGMAYEFEGRFEEALGEIRRSLDLFDGVTIGWIELACVLANQGEREQACNALSRARQLETDLTLQSVQRQYRLMLGTSEKAVESRMHLLRELGLP